MFNMYWCCAVLIVDVFNQLFSGYAGVDKLMVSNSQEKRYCWADDLPLLARRAEVVRLHCICGHL